MNNFPILFPPEHPLDFRAFQSLAKLVLVRRIVKALVTHHGLYRCSGECARPSSWT